MHCAGDIVKGGETIPTWKLFNGKKSFQEVKKTTRLFHEGHTTKFAAILWNGKICNHEWF